MLVRLYALPPIGPVEEKLQAKGVTSRRPLPSEKSLVVGWVRKNFSAGWADECEVAFSHDPPSCFIALENEEIMGFACYEATCKDFFGPAGTLESARGRGIGRLNLLKCLHAMRAEGYAYAVIGGVGPREFYAGTVGAVVIEGSDPGIYPVKRA